MFYLSQSLTFEEDKIYFTSPLGEQREVMMDWEDGLMSSSAAYVTQNGGDILEIGFGMGISANYIQSASITSHTIVENHPDIIPKAQEWALDKSNVTIVTGSWYDVLGDLSTYDGIFYDTYGDEHYIYFSSSLSQLVKEGTVVTWWNTLSTSSNVFNISNVGYQTINTSPPTNSYYNFTEYYLPKKQF